MARRVFFSFHFDDDIWRANQVRNSNVVAGTDVAGFFDHSEYEEAKREGDEGIKRMILRHLHNTTVTVVLIGTKTAQRRWVKYEIEQSIKRDNGLLGVYIHHLKDRNGHTSLRGQKPSVPSAVVFPVYDWDAFYDDYVKALDEGYAALFAGAGLSRPSGFVDWKGLMRDIARELSLDVDLESDLIALAQYHVNTRAGRSRLNRLLIGEFTKDVEITENHRLIAKLPLRSVWTSNYDKLIEQAFQEAHKRPDVKITQENLATTLPKRDVTIYKMHGDISQPQDAVLIKEDYETYNEKRALFSDLLKGDLISKTFLFLGFSFTDPNIDYILRRIRTLLGQNQREHYCIMRRIPKPRGGGKARAKYDYEKTKLELRIADLRRYSIRALMIDDYSEITEVLEELNRRSHRKDIFVSGSADSYEPMGRDYIEKLALVLGREIIRRGYNLISGFGLGIGGAVIVGAMEALYAENKDDIEERVMLRPFPQEPPQGMTQEQFWSKYREEMISNAGFTIFLCGNKLDPSSGQTVLANGALEEFEITKKFHKYPIPVGATGYAAQRIWEEMTTSLDQFYPRGGARYSDGGPQEVLLAAGTPRLGAAGAGLPARPGAGPGRGPGGLSRYQPPRRTAAGKENLCHTDAAVVAARRRLLEAVRTVREGGNAPGADESYYHLRAIERILPADAHWLEVLKPEMYPAGAPI